MTTTHPTTKGETMALETIETRNGSRVVISDNRNTAGIWESRLYVNDGETATRKSAEHKTRTGAVRWAKKVLAK